MQVGAPVAISAEVGAAHRGQRLDGGSDDDEEPPELTRQLGRQIGEVVMLARHQHGRDRQTRALRTCLLYTSTAAATICSGVSRMP